MVLWRQPGNSYSDCVCPNGQSIATDTIQYSYDQTPVPVKLHKFGRCSDSYIPTTKDWASSIDSSLISWIDSTNIYNSEFIADEGDDIASLNSRSSAYKKNFPSNDDGIVVNYSIITKSSSDSLMYNKNFPTNIT
ncbi:MAG: hypothetical protein EOP45_17410, partial [Sphingobacteriaceae bacterium]